MGRDLLMSERIEPQLNQIIKFIKRDCPYPGEPEFELATEIINTGINEIFLNLYRIDRINEMGFRNDSAKKTYLKNCRFNLNHAWRFLNDDYLIEIYSACTIRDGALVELVIKGLNLYFDKKLLKKELLDYDKKEKRIYN